MVTNTKARESVGLNTGRVDEPLVAEKLRKFNAKRPALIMDRKPTGPSANI